MPGTIPHPPPEAPQAAEVAESVLGDCFDRERIPEATGVKWVILSDYALDERVFKGRAIKYRTSDLPIVDFLRYHNVLLFRVDRKEERHYLSKHLHKTKEQAHVVAAFENFQPWVMLADTRIPKKIMDEYKEGSLGDFLIASQFRVPAPHGRLYRLWRWLKTTGVPKAMTAVVSAAI